MSPKSLRALVALTLVSGAHAAFAQTYPSRPVKFVVASTAGGPIDITARLAADGLQKRLGQPIVVENRPGGGMLIAIDTVTKSPADGYTLLVGASLLSFGHLSFKQHPYEPLRDLTPIAIFSSAGNFLAVPAARPWQTFADLVAYAKANPGRVLLGEAGAPDLNIEDLLSKLDIKVEHVRYKGNDHMSGLVAGDIDLAATNAGILNSLKGKVRALIYTDSARHPAAPDVPTVSETLLPGTSYRAWIGLVGPAGLPTGIVTRLNGEVNAVVANPEVTARIREMGRAPFVGDAAAMAKIMAAEEQVGKDALARGALVPQ